MRELTDMHTDIDASATDDAQYINSVLLEVQESWARMLYSRLKEEYDNDGQKGKLSCAFSFGVSDDYVKAGKKIMVVGQEANDHTYDGWPLAKWQKWAVAYLEYQLDIDKNNEYGIEPNPSAFWQFLNKLKKKGYGVCWNNLDKVRRYVEIDGKGWAEDKLPYDKQNRERALLNCKIFNCNKSLLQREIEIAAPDIVVFAVGPNNPYYHTLYSAFLDDDYNKILKSCPWPTVKEPCRDISDILHLKAAYYTYHPNYLNQSKKLDEVVATITKQRK